MSANNDKEVVTETNGQFSTRAIHVGQSPSQWSTRAVIPPIHLSTIYEVYSRSESNEFFYGRYGNPNRQCLEEAVAAVEGAKYGLCYSSGMAAQVNVTHLLQSGDHIVSSDDIYSGCNIYFKDIATRFGLEVSFVDTRDPEIVAKVLTPNTRLVWIETPSNPIMRLVDIESVAKVVKSSAPKALLAVDNTFMSSYFQKPLLLGADLSMQSLSKYINGHSDVIMGALTTNRKDIYDRLKYLQTSLGCIPSPFDCFLVNRGLKTLAARMEQHMKNGLAVARYLESHPMIEKVIHPALESHPQHELALRQCAGFSGMVSAYIRGNGDTTELFLKNLKLFTLAVSLGGTESLVSIPALTTHKELPAQTKRELGIDETLIRLSVGLEATEDLVSDLRHALEVVKNSVKN